MILSKNENKQGGCMGAGGLYLSPSGNQLTEPGRVQMLTQQQSP